MSSKHQINLSPYIREKTKDMAQNQYMHSKKDPNSKGTAFILLFFISKIQWCLQHGLKKNILQV